MPDYIDDEIFLFVSWDDDDKAYIPIAEDRIALRREDTLDVAAIKLLPETAAKLLKRHIPLTLDRIDRDCRDADGYFAIVGYPRAGFKSTGRDSTMLTPNHPSRNR